MENTDNKQQKRFLVRAHEVNEGRFYTIKGKDGNIRAYDLPENCEAKVMYLDTDENGKNHYFNGDAIQVYVSEFKDFKTGKAFERFTPVNSEKLILPVNSSIITVIKSVNKDGKAFYHKNAVPTKFYTFKRTLKDGTEREFSVPENDVQIKKSIVLEYSNGDTEKLIQKV